MEPIKLFGAGGAPDRDIDWPEGGGLVVLAGSNGCGKSQTLNAIEALTTGAKTIGVKHGRSHGEVSGFGVSIKLGGRTTRQGELDVVGYSSRMDIAGIVDPGLKERDPANRAIVKSIVRMLGLSADARLFHPLCSHRTADDTDESYDERCRSQFDAIMEAGIGEDDDLVDIARKVKRGFDAAARRVKGEAERVQGEADALLAADANLDMDAPHESAELAAELERTVGAEAALFEKSKAHNRLKDDAQAARDKLGSGGGPTDEDFQGAHDELTEAAKALDEADQAEADAGNAVDAAEQVLKDARALYQSAASARMAASAAKEAAGKHLDTLEESETGWKAAKVAIARLESAEDAPGEDDLEGARGAVTAAREAIERGALVRHALEQLEKGKKRRLNAANLRGREQELRDAGRGTDGVLSQLINKAGVEGLTVVDGEVLAVPPGETEPRPFLDLSDGQRTRVAVDATIPVVRRDLPEGELAVIVLGQRVYQDLDFENRQALRRHVEGRRVLLFTALPTEGDMQAIVVDEGSDDGVRA